MKARFNPPLMVFTKPWKSPSLEALADHVAALGFDGVELPVRPGFQVEPDAVEENLPKAQAVFRARGLKIASVAGNLDEPTIRACGAAERPILRVMLRIQPELGYARSVEAFRRQVETLTPLLRETGVVVGLQNHAGDFVGSAIGLMEVLGPLEKDCAQAVLDFGHTALAGEPEPIALDIAAPRLALVNLKNAIQRLDAEDAEGVKTWKRHWTRGRGGLTSWRTAVAELARRDYPGAICLTAEYHDADGKPVSGEAVDSLIRADVAFLREILKTIQV